MAKIQELQYKWLALSKRERWMIFGAGLIGLVGIIDTFMLEPLRQQDKLAREQVIQFAADSTKLQAQLAMLKQSSIGGNAQQMQQIKALQEKLKLQQTEMLSMSVMMVKPSEILPLLRTLLKKHDDVEVVNLTSLPVENFIKKHLEKTDSVTPKEFDDSLDQVYQHTLKLTVRGDYLAVMRYVGDLKQHASVLSWETGEMKSAYPKIELTVHLYTLSLQNVWLGI